MAVGESMTQMIFFITAVTVATTLVFALNSNFQSFMKSLNNKAKSVSNQVATAIKIVNDPCYLNYTIFVKNVGSSSLTPNSTDILINGELKSPQRVQINTGGSTWADVTSTTKWDRGYIIAFNMSTELPKGNEINRIKVITETGIYDEIIYTNSTC